MQKRKKNILETNSQNVGKPKGLLKALKPVGLPNKSGRCTVSALAENQIVKQDTKSVLKTFYSNLAGTLLTKLPKPSNQYTINFVSVYYGKLTISENFKLVPTVEDALFKLLKSIKLRKVARIDQFLGNFMKDWARILAKPVSELCNLSTTLRSFPNACKIAMLKPVFKKTPKANPSNYRPISLLPLLNKVKE